MDNSEDKNPADESDSTPLHNAARRGHRDICSLILSHTENTLPRNSDGETPLDLARLMGCTAVAELWQAPKNIC